MDSGTLAPVGRVFSKRFDDPDAFTEAIRGASVENLPLEPGSYSASLTAMMLNDVGVQRARIPPIVSRGSVDAQSFSLLLPLTPGLDPIVNGAALDDTRLALLRPGDDFHSVVRTALSWGSVSLTAGTFEEIFEGWGLPPSRSRAPIVIDAGPATKLRRSISALADLGDELPHLIETPDVAIAMGKSVVELIAAMRFGPEPAGSSFRQTGQMMRIMNAAEDYLAANMMKPIYSEDLCRALGVSQRKLHAVFVTACGVSPQAYLKFRRLALVRRALRRGGPTALVKSAALSHGFWHLGNFAHDYRTYFGESPSDTLHAAHPS